MAEKLTAEALRALPKVELHCHLDGSVPVEMFQALAEKGARGVPADRQALLAAIQAPRPCRDLAQYLAAFGLTLHLLRDMDTLWQATVALGAALAAEHVVYAELRFSPQSLASPKADAGTVVATVLNALAVAQREHKVVLRVLLCMMRHAPEEENLAVLDLAHRHAAEGVAGVDLAGDEAAYPAVMYRELFFRAKEMGLPYTIHAGECGSAQNVRDSVAMGARRIGHGVAAVHEPSLCRTLAREGVLLENCPISNLQTGAVKSLADYPTPSFVRWGVPVCLFTDNRTVSNTTLAREYAALAEAFPGIDRDFFKQRNLQALAGAFLPEREKAPLRAAIEAGCPTP